MRLYIIRHAIAEDREEFALSGQEDSLRPLTSKGQKKFEKISEFLFNKINHIDLVISSPYKRAFQTAEILRNSFAKSEFHLDERLVPYAKMSDSLKMISDLNVPQIAVVGHEPHLSSFISYLVTGHDHSFMDLKKGSVTCLEFFHKPNAGQGVIKWYITPGIIL